MESCTSSTAQQARFCTLFRSSTWRLGGGGAVACITVLTMFRRKMQDQEYLCPSLSSPLKCKREIKRLLCGDSHIPSSLNSAMHYLQNFVFLDGDFCFFLICDLLCFPYAQTSFISPDSVPLERAVQSIHLAVQPSMTLPRLLRTMT